MREKNTPKKKNRAEKRRKGIRLIAFLLILTMIMSVAGCSGGGSSAGKEETTGNPSGQETRQKVAEEDTGEETAPADEREDGEASGEKESEKDVEEPVLTSSETEEEKTVDIAEDADISNDVDETADSPEKKWEKLTTTQLTSINMINYMAVLTHQIKESDGDQMVLEDACSSLYNETYLKAVDEETEAQIVKLGNGINSYRMISKKKERLQYIYERNKAKAFKKAASKNVTKSNVADFLSAVASKDLLKGLVAVLKMAKTLPDYLKGKNSVEKAYLEEGWTLDDDETMELQNSASNDFQYKCEMVRKYDLPDEYIVREKDVEAFVKWSKKTNLVGKIDWFASNESRYQKFGPYWLELVKDYYEYGDYEKCLESIKRYEENYSKITRTDYDYADALPMVIVAAKETLSDEEYMDIAKKYCQLIRENTKDEDWALRYFAAQVYLDIYRISRNKDDLKDAYEIVYYNVNVLLDEQKSLNEAYLAPVQKVRTEKTMTKRQKRETKEYNKLLKAERKIALPPVSEAFYLNCDLLFSLMDKCGFSGEERERVDTLLHEKGNALFLIESVDERFRMNTTRAGADTDQPDIRFEGDEMILPANLISDRYIISASISGSGGTTTVNDWTISKVDRPKKGTFEDYTAVLKSKKAKEYKYKEGDSVTLTITPLEDAREETLEYSYKVVSRKKAVVVKSLTFKRVTE